MGQTLPEREHPGTGRKEAWPTAIILDTQSVKNVATGTTVCFDADKRLKGHKRLVLTNTLGLVLARRVLPAGQFFELFRPGPELAPDSVGLGLAIAR